MLSRFVDRLNGVRSELNNLDGDIKAECARFSEDIKYFAEFTTGDAGGALTGNYVLRVKVSRRSSRG